jgi:hypothetical protein
MKTGLETMQGISDATRSIAQTILTGNVPQRQNHRGKVRTKLKQSFKGSYGHIYSLEIYDEALKRKFNSIGKATFAEIISYFIAESLYLESSELSEKASRIIGKLGDKSELLVKQLRRSSMENLHEISTKFNHEVEIRYRKSRNAQTVIAKINKDTAKALLAKPSQEKYDITASITRLNINTGNGRLLVKGETETVAFGFGTRYKQVRLQAKKIFFENLDHNNGLNSEDWKLLKIEVQPIKLRDGKIVKYIVLGYYEN